MTLAPRPVVTVSPALAWLFSIWDPLAVKCGVPVTFRYNIKHLMQLRAWYFPGFDLLIALDVFINYSELSRLGSNNSVKRNIHSTWRNNLDHCCCRQEWRSMWGMLSKSTFQDPQRKFALLGSHPGESSRTGTISSAETWVATSRRGIYCLV